MYWWDWNSTVNVQALTFPVASTSFIILWLIQFISIVSTSNIDFKHDIDPREQFNIASCYLDLSNDLDFTFPFLGGVCNRSCARYFLKLHSTISPQSISCIVFNHVSLLIMTIGHITRVKVKSNQHGIYLENRFIGRGGGGGLVTAIFLLYTSLEMIL